MLSENFDIKIETAWEERRANLRATFNTGTHLLKEAIQEGYKKGIADCSKVLGYCYWRFSDYSKSLQFSLEAIELYTELSDKKGEADTLNSLGAVYMFQNDNEKRLECNIKCMQLREEIQDFEGVSGSMNNIGETYFEMKDFSNAQEWLNKCLDYSHSSLDSKAWAFHNLGKIEQIKGNWNNSIEYYEKCLDITTLDKYDVLTCESYLRLCEIYFSQKKYVDAESFGLQALNLAKEIGAKEYQKTALFLLSSIKENEGEEGQALVYHKAFHVIHETIFNEENNQKIKDIGYQYEIDKISKEAEIERLKKVELAKAYQEIEQKNLLIEQKNIDITDSIRYAKKIQQALLKPENHVSEHLPEHFILHKPKDIVSGDFYWVSEKGNYLYLAVSDCTGHGVPGAFLTMLGTSFLNEIISSIEVLTPAEILNRLRDKFITELGQTKTRDGMDISLIRIDLNQKSFQWSGAIRPLLIFRKQKLEMEVFKGDKQSICFSESRSSFTNVNGVLNEGDIIYLFSDGYADQFGGERGKKFKMKPLIKLLSFLHNQPLSKQKEALDSSFENWKGNLEQIDDVCVIGLKL